MVHSAPPGTSHTTAPTGLITRLCPSNGGWPFADLRTAWDALQELYQLYEAEDLDGANQALGRFADLYATGQIPEYHQVVDTIIAWGEQILAYHTTRRVSNGPIEGTNNLLQVLRRVAHGFTNYDNYAARGILVT